MKNFLSVAGVVLLVAGAIWFLQGINVLPGSFMTGQPKWAVIGGVCGVAGLAALVLARWL